MHAVIVGLSDATYTKLIALCTDGLDHSWLATNLLEEAIEDAPIPGRCKICGGELFNANHKGGAWRVYCSDPCRTKGYRARQIRWWRKKGKAWREKHPRTTRR